MFNYQNVVINELKLNDLKLAVAESATGGMIASSLTNVPGASKVFLGGFVTYTNEMKHKLLGVSLDTLNGPGAVSEQCVKEMAEGVYKKTKADVILTISGNAGPTGSEGKEVGLFYLCIMVIDKCYIYQFKTESKNRLDNKVSFASKALEELSKLLLKFRINHGSK